MPLFLRLDTRAGRCILAGEVTRCWCGRVSALLPRLLFRLKPRGHSAAAPPCLCWACFTRQLGWPTLDTPLCTGVSSCLSTQTGRSVPSVESVVSLVASATAPSPCAAARLPGSYGWNSIEHTRLLWRLRARSARTVGRSQYVSHWRLLVRGTAVGGMPPRPRPRVLGVSLALEICNEKCCVRTCLLLRSSTAPVCVPSPARPP